MVNRLGERTTERWRNKKLPWYAEEKAKDGSFATFVGLTLECYDDKLRTWIFNDTGHSAQPVQTRLTGGAHFVGDRRAGIGRVVRADG